MRASNKVRKVSRDIIKHYVFYIRGKIRDLDVDYVRSGIDKNFDIYESLFGAVLRQYLGVEAKPEDKMFSYTIINECIDVIAGLVDRKKYSSIVEKYSNELYNTCLLIFSKVEEGLLENGDL